MKKIIILGAGGSGHDIVSLIKSINKIKIEFEIVGFLDDNPALWGKSFIGVNVLGPINDSINYNNCLFISSIANPINRLIRRNIFERVKRQGGEFCSLIHPNVVFYDNVVVGEGVVINANCVLGSNVFIGDDVHFGYGCNIAHESKIGSHTSFGAGVNLSSNTLIGADCYIGCGVSSAHDIKVCENTLVASGSAIIEDLRDNNDTWIGVPTVELRKYVKNKYKLERLNLK